MFYIVHPTDRQNFKPLLEEMSFKSKKELKYYSKPFFPPFLQRTTKDSLYILFCHDSFGVCGSAHLFPSTSSSISLPYLQEETFESTYLWECNQLFFYLPAESPLLEDSCAFKSLAENFYQGLYKVLRTFAKTHHIRTLVVINSVTEHEDITFFGKWPWTFQSHLTTEGYPEYALGLLSFDLMSASPS